MLDDVKSKIVGFSTHLTIKEGVSVWMCVCLIFVFPNRHILNGHCACFKKEKTKREGERAAVIE